MVAIRFTRRRAAAAALLVPTALGLAWAAYRASLDPWPARAMLRGEWPIAFTPDGRSFVMDSGGRVVVRDWATGAVRSSWPLAANEVAVRGDYSPDGGTLAVAVRQNFQPVKVLLIDVPTGRVRATGTARHPQFIGFRFTPDGASVRMGAADSSGLREFVSFDATSGAVEFAGPPVPPAGTDGVASSADARFLFYFDAKGGPILIQEVGTAASGPGPTVTGPASAGSCGAIDCSHDGRTLAVGRLDGTIDLWDIPGKRPIRTIPAPAGGYASWVTLAPDGRTVVARWNEPESPYLRLLNQASRAFGRPVAPPPSEWIVLDCTTGRRLARSPSATWLYYSPDGRMVAAHDVNRHLVELRDVPPD